MMLHVPNVLNMAQVQTLRARLDTADWLDGKTTVGQQGAQVKANRQLAEHSSLSRELGAIVLGAVKTSDLFFACALPLRFVSPLFNRYECGETYGLHVDGAMRPQPAGDGWLRTDVSCTLFLSDPEDYDGGDLEVTDTYGTHAVKLPAGDLVLYPSSSLHQVTPVTRGARVCSFFWLQSLIRDDARRQILFDLDMTIRALRGRLGDTTEVLSLTGHYHNLLRQWAEA